MQKIEIMGYVGKDAVVRNSNGNDITTFNVCVSESYKNKDGEPVQKNTWYGCVYRKTGVANFIKKGDLIFVEGELNAKVYTNDKRETSLDLTVNVARIEFCNNKPKDNANE